MIILNRKADGNFVSDNGRWLFLRYELGWNVRDKLTGEFFNAVSIQAAKDEAERRETFDKPIELGIIG